MAADRSPFQVAPYPRLTETALRFRGVCTGAALGFLLKGLLVGIVIALPVGPVGVLCIRRTILHGRLAGFVSGLGAASADAVFGVIAAFGLTFVSDVLFEYQSWLRLGGAAFLLYVGISSFTADPIKGTQRQRDPDGLIADYLSAFALTVSNPITILSFLAIFAAIGFSGPEATLSSAAILVLGVWLGSFLWWVGLAFCAGRVRLTFNRDHLVWINRGSGGILLCCGAVLLGSVLLHHFG